LVEEDFQKISEFDDCTTDNIYYLSNLTIPLQKNDMKQIHLINLISVNVDQNNDFTSLSHIPQFEDTNTSPTEDVDVSAG